MNRLIALFALFALASASKFSDCGSTSGVVTTVVISDCPDSVAVCDLKRETSKNITINFNSQSKSAKVKAVVHGVIGGIPLPFSLPKNDGCKSGLSCPLQNGQPYVYTNNLAIKKSYPPLSVTVRWELQDDDGEDIICVEIPCQIV